MRRRKPKWPNTSTPVGATISRLLLEARRQGIVRIEVIPADNKAADDVASRVVSVLGLTAVYIADPLPILGRGEELDDLMGSVLRARSDVCCWRWVSKLAT